MESKNIAYLERLDHIRFFAAAMILVLHSYLDYPIYRGQDFYAFFSTYLKDRPWQIPLLMQGHTGVPLFMVVSGLILSLIVAGKEIQSRNFYKNRVLRIYPLALFLIMFGYFATTDPRSNSYTVELSFLAGLIPIDNLSWQALGPISALLWSIAVEFQFYLIFPFLCLFRLRYGRRYFFGLIAFFMLLRWMVFEIYGSVHLLSFFSIFGNLDIFLIGMLTGEGYLYCRKRWGENRQCWWKHPFLPFVLFIGINFIFYLIFSDRDFFHVDYQSVESDHLSKSRLWIVWPTLQGLIWAFFVFVYLESAIKIPFSSLAATLGKYSYSIYAWHPFIILLVNKHPLAWITPMSLGPFIVLPITLVVAAASYHLIELPFLSMRVRYTTNPSLSAGTAAA